MSNTAFVSTCQAMNARLIGYMCKNAASAFDSVMEVCLNGSIGLSNGDVDSAEMYALTDSLTGAGMGAEQVVSDLRAVLGCTACEIDNDSSEATAQLRIAAHDALRCADVVASELDKSVFGDDRETAVNAADNAAGNAYCAFEELRKVAEQCAATFSTSIFNAPTIATIPAAVIAVSEMNPGMYGQFLSSSK